MYFAVLLFSTYYFKCTWVNVDDWLPRVYSCVCVCILVILSTALIIHKHSSHCWWWWQFVSSGTLAPLVNTLIFLPSVCSWLHLHKSQGGQNECGQCHYFCSIIVYLYLFYKVSNWHIWYWALYATVLLVACFVFIKLVTHDDDHEVPTGTSLVLQKLLTREFTWIYGQPIGCRKYWVFSWIATVYSCSWIQTIHNKNRAAVSDKCYVWLKCCSLAKFWPLPRPVDLLPTLRETVPLVGPLKVPGETEEKRRSLYRIHQSRLNCITVFLQPIALHQHNSC